MEILSTSTYVEPSLIGFGIIVLGIAIGFIGVHALFAGIDLNEWIPSLIGVGLLVLGVYVIANFHDTGGTEYVKHEVIVHDFNEVVEQGYEVIEMDDKIVTILKPKEDDK